MTNFNDLSKKPIRFLSFTGFKLEEFLALLPHFTLKFQQYMENFTVEGKKRKKRKYVEYKSACLPLMENKLLFILTDLKGNDLQERIAEMFVLSQPKANIWIHLLHKVLNQTLDEMEVLPTRDADSLEKKLNKLAEETATIEAEIEATSIEEETLETTVEVEVTSIEEETLETTEVEATSIEEETLETTVEVEATSIESDTFDPTNNEVETMIDIDLYLHDGFERPINRPLNETIQKIFYSGKRKQHTLKNVERTDVSCYVLFLSDTCSVQKHDKKVADEVGYNLPEGSYLGQDTGFQGLEIPGVNIVQPKKKPRGGELTEEEKERNRTISSVRVRVEHAICFVTRYRIVKDKLRNWKHGFKDKVIETCCGLHNFRLKFRPWNYETAVI
jgi:hypothetical protein